MTEPDRPQPVVDAATRLGTLFAAVVLAIGLLWFVIAEGVTRDNIGTVATLAGGAVTALAAFGAYVWAKVQGRRAAAEVTPTADPRDDRGVRLIPVDGGGYGGHAPDGRDDITVGELRARIDSELDAQRFLHG